jgi:hypothetical protein
MIPKYLLLESATDSPLTPTEAFRAQGGRELKCSECRFLRRGCESVDIEVKEKSLSQQTPLIFCSSFCTVVHENLVESLLCNQALPNDISVGTVSNAASGVFNGWKTLNSRQPVFVRSNPPPPRGYPAKYRVCSTCSRVIYSCWSRDFIFPAPDAQRKLMLVFGFDGALVLRVDSDIELFRVKKLALNFYVRELELLDKPRDGIEAILEPYEVTPLPTS